MLHWPENTRGCKKRTPYATDKAARMANHMRGHVAVPEDVHPLVRKLFVEMNRQKTTIKELSLRSGVGVQTISGWRYSYMPRLDTLDACFNALGKTLVVKETAE